MNKIIKSALILVAGFAFAANVEAGKTLKLKVKNNTSYELIGIISGEKEYKEYQGMKTENKKNIFLQETKNDVKTKAKGNDSVDLNWINPEKDIKLATIFKFQTIDNNIGYGQDYIYSYISLIKATYMEKNKPKDVVVIKVGKDDIEATGKDCKFYADLEAKTEITYQNRYNTPIKQSILKQIKPTDSISISVNGEDLIDIS